MKKEVSLSLILAQRIIELFDEAGANKAERYCAINLVTAMIPVSVNEGGEDATSTIES
ncbi:MAG TPA: hypothetical protein VF779_09320 [Pyrinomonadaceae bacterium]